MEDTNDWGFVKERQLNDRVIAAIEREKEYWRNRKGGLKPK